MEEQEMSINDMDSKIKELWELRRMADELAVEMESITDSIKRHMADLHSTGKRILLLRGQPPGIERQQTERLRR